MKKYKTARKAIPNAAEYIGVRYEIECPFCFTHMIGGFSRNTSRLICYECGNEIIIDWNKVDKK